MRVLVLALAFVAAHSTGSAAAAGVTLAEAIPLALAHNPDLAATAQELRVAAGEQIRAGYLSQFNPQLDSEFDYRPRDHRSNSQDWRVGLSQELEIFGQRALRMKSANLGYAETAALVRDRRRLLTAAVRMTFLEALRAKQQLALVGELERLDSRLLTAARARLKAGEIGYIDYNLAEVRHGQSARALLEARQRYQLQCTSLGRLLGGAAGPQPEPAGDFDLKLSGFDVESLLAAAHRNRPDLRAREIELARLDAEAALNRRLVLPNPRIGAFGGHELNAEHPFGVSLSFPLPLFNRRQAEVAIIDARRRQADYRLAANKLDIDKEVRDAYIAYTTASRALAIYQDEVLAPARESFSLLERAFQAGKIDLLSVSVAERQAYDARASYLDTWFSVRAAEVALELATGGGM
ncbi:MAG TPA: TolC family protein [Candidatus Binataceae bacterium]|nr:TolC family protein [Candidatus Binataceae bacterium]